MNNYFNEKSSLNIKKYIDKEDYQKALSLIYDYMEDYPEDTFVMFNYVDVLLRLGRYKEAEEVLCSIDLDELKKVPEKKEKRQEYMALFKLKIAVAMERYEEAYKIIEDNQEIFDRRGYQLNADKFILLRKLGKEPPEELKMEIWTYLLSQSYQYSEEDFYDHIQKHLFDQTEDNNTGAVFCKDFPYKKVVEELKEKIKGVNCELDSITVGKYNIKYDNCGYVNGKLVNTFRMVVFVNTTDFITMFPYDNPHIEPHFDITPTIELDKPKQKRLSQIEKFNLKYNKETID